MAAPDSIALAGAAESEGLESVLVGGNAVNLYAYRRTTFDVDLLVRETDSGRWLTFFEQRGYRIFHRTANFIRLHFANEPKRPSAKSTPKAAAAMLAKGFTLRFQPHFTSSR